MNNNLDKIYKILDMIKECKLNFNLNNLIRKNLVYIVYSNHNIKEVNIVFISKNDIDIAKSFYKELQKKNNITSVFVDSNDLIILKKVYPNYFEDSKKFINYIERMINE